MAKNSLDSAFIRKVIKKYRVGELAAKPVKMEGDLNLNYRLRTNKGEFLLKYIQDKNYLPIFEYSGHLHEKLTAGGVPVPRMLKVKNPKGKIKYVHNSCILYPYIDGNPKKTWTNAELKSLVANLGKIHAIMKNVKVPKSIKEKKDPYALGINIEYSKRNIIPKILKTKIGKRVKDTIKITSYILTAGMHGYERLPKQITHNDLNDSNAIFKNNKNVGIIDFALGYEAQIYDFAVMVYWFAFPWWHKKINFKRFETMVRFYNKVNRMDPQEKELFPYLLLRRSFLNLTLPFIFYFRGLDKKLFTKYLHANLRRNQALRRAIPRMASILRNI